MIIHTELAGARWNSLSLNEQLGNVGSDIERAIYWRDRGDSQASHNAFLRALELLNFTISDPKNKNHRLRELCRVREALLDYFMGNNEYESTDQQWVDYFMFFAYAHAYEKANRRVTSSQRQSQTSPHIQQ